MLPGASGVGGSIYEECCNKVFDRSSENEEVMENQKSKTKSWISFRVKPAEYDRIHNFFSATTCRKLSEYARNVLLQKPVVVKYRNQSADDFLVEVLQLKKELNAIGNNYNQAVKKLHTLDEVPAVNAWLNQNKILHESFLKKTEEILLKTDQIHRQWLSK